MSDNLHGCDTIRELVPEYAFGLTDPEQTRLVRSNLASCPDAATTLAEYDQLKAYLRQSVPPMEPPPALRARLMTAIKAPSGAAAATAATAAPARKFPRLRGVQRGWLAAGIAILFLVISNLYWLARTNDLSTAKGQTAIQNTAGFTATSTDGLRLVKLPSTPQGNEAWAIMMWNADSQIGLLCAWKLPKLTVGKTYQLWLTRGEEKISAGTFKVDPDGKGILIFTVVQPIDKFTWARITAEPESGSDSPSEIVFVNGKITT